MVVGTRVDAGRASRVAGDGAAALIRTVGPDTGASRFAHDGPVRLVIGVYPPLWGELLAQVLGREMWIEVVGRAADEDELRRLASEKTPKVILLDYEGLGPNAEGLVSRLRRLAPKVRVLVLARRSGAQTVVSLLRAGAAGLVGKDVNLRILLNALRAVAAGEVWAERKAAAQALDQLAAPVRAEPNGQVVLTRREWEVVEAVGRGLRNRDIARALGISEKTVKTHLNHIFSKLHVDSRFALALWAQGGVQPKA
jgi:DNA-binding NarL/FixJ family response regulator